MNILRRLKYRKTSYVGGGLIPTEVKITKKNIFATARNFEAPKRLDFREMCLQTDNQGSTPHCAGFSTAGMIEVKNWRENNYPEQVDADGIYLEAKKIDGNTAGGTSLESAGQAALDLGLIKGKLKFISEDQNNIKFAIHKHLTFVGGFMITDEWNMVNKNTGEIANFNNPVNIGGHAVLVCGYCPVGIYIHNSWGSNWGHYGFALIPWNKVTTQFMYGMTIV